MSHWDRFATSPIPTYVRFVVCSCPLPRLDSVLWRGKSSKLLRRRIQEEVLCQEQDGFRTGLQLHYMQERCLGRVYLIKILCKILNVRGQISSTFVGLVGERMCKKPHVSSLDKSVLFTWWDSVNDMSTWCDRVSYYERKL